MDHETLQYWLQIGTYAVPMLIYVAGALKWGWNWLWAGAAWMVRVVRCAIQRACKVWDNLEKLDPFLNGPASVPAGLQTLRIQGEERGRELMAHGERLNVMDRKLDAVANTQRAVMNTNPRLATFEADDQGLWTSVGRLFLKWTGLVSASDAKRRAWMAVVNPADGTRVELKWESCVADGVRFECRFRIVNVITSKVVEIEATADAIPEGTVPAERWVGAMQEVQKAQ